MNKTSTAAIRAYVVTSTTQALLPPILRNLESGIQEVEDSDRDLQIVVRDINGERYVLALDTRSLDQVEHAFDLALYTGVVLFSLLSLGLGYWGSGCAIAPVRKLAREVRALGELPPDATPTLRGSWANDEVGELARAFEAYMRRLQGFIERERSFTADVSHELPNPIMAMSSSLYLLLLKTAPIPERQRWLLRMNRAVDRMSELVEAFLSLAREGVNDYVP